MDTIDHFSRFKVQEKQWTQEVSLIQPELSVYSWKPIISNVFALFIHKTPKD